MGYSPVTLSRQAIGLGIAAEEFGASLFGNGSIPKGVIKTAKRLTPEAAANLRRSWEVMHQGTKSANGTAVLEEGMTWESITIPPEDAQFLATRQFQVLEIARIYRLPPHKLGDFSRATFSNIEETNLDYLMTSLMPWLIQVEQEWGRKLLTREDRRAGYFLKHDMSALLRGNMQARADYYTKLQATGALSPNQIASMGGPRAGRPRRRAFRPAQYADPGILERDRARGRRPGRRDEGGGRMSKPSVEKRYLKGPKSGLSLRADTPSNSLQGIKGYAAVFNSPSEDLGGFFETIRPGAFGEAIEECDVRALVDHNPSLILGRLKAGTLRLAEDDRGLACEIDPADTNTGRDIVVSPRPRRRRSDELRLRGRRGRMDLRK